MSNGSVVDKSNETNELLSDKVEKIKLESWSNSSLG